MTRKHVVCDKMTMHFMEAGKVQTYHEYLRNGGGPVRLHNIKRIMGTWARLIAMCDRLYPDRMAAARGQVAVQEETPEVVEPAPAESKIITAREALAKLGGTDE